MILVTIVDMILPLFLNNFNLFTKFDSAYCEIM